MAVIVPAPDSLGRESNETDSVRVHLAERVSACGMAAALTDGNEWARRS